METACASSRSTDPRREYRRRWREANREHIRAYDRDYADTHPTDGFRREQQREWARRKRGWQGRYSVSRVKQGDLDDHTDRRVSAEPFADWLRARMVEYRLRDATQVGRAYHLDRETVRRLLQGKLKYVYLSTVDRALAHSHTMLWELYPE